MDNLQKVINSMVSENLQKITDAITENILDELCEAAKYEARSKYPLCEIDVIELKEALLQRMKIGD